MQTPSTKELTKELEKGSVEITRAETYATGLVVKSKEDYDAAMAEGLAFKAVLDKLESREKEITAPLKEALDSVTALFKPNKLKVKEALATIKLKMGTWYTEEEKRVAEEKAKLLAREGEGKGKLKPETVLKKTNEIATPDKTVKSEAGKATVRKIPEYVVTDESKLPREFLMPDMAKIKEALKFGKEVPGAEIREKVVTAFS